MARQQPGIFSLNGGEVSRLALSRIDLPQLTICGELVENWFTSTLGWMGIRPGTQKNGAPKNNAKPQFLRFVGSASACSLIELTPNVLRVWNDDALVTRTAVTTIIGDGDFSALTAWTIVTPGGGSASTSGGRAQIAGNGISRTRIYQPVTVPSDSAGKEHGIRIVVDRGPVRFSIGTAAGLDDIVSFTDLAKGVHSLAVTLTGTVYVEFSALEVAPRLIDSISFEAAGVMEIAAPWDTDAIGKVRVSQQGDVLFCAARGYQQRRIESRSRRSWSVVEYFAPSGPFLAQGAAPPTLTSDVRTGVGTLTASAPVFRDKHVGAIFELTHPGQTISATLSGPDQYTSAIRVTGVGGARKFTVGISGSFVGTLRLQQAVGAPEGWINKKSYTAPVGTDTYDDEYDNSIVYYRLGFVPGEYTSGSATVTLTYPGGTTVGVVRIISVSSPTSASIEVVKALGGTTGTSLWREGAWSDYRGWPRDVTFQDGRLWWLEKNLLDGSVSDDFANFDDSTTGDSAPVRRSVGTGPADGNVWLLRLFRMIVASAASVTGIRSSSLDEPIKQDAFSAREIAQAGAADIAPVAISNRGIFAGRSGIDLFQVVPSADIGDYAVSLINRLHPEFFQAGIVRIAVQNRPEPRIWCVMADGKVRIVTYNPDEKVISLHRWVTDGLVEECEILPNLSEDMVHLCVNRLLNGQWVRQVERCSYEMNAVGGVDSGIVDCGRVVVPTGLVLSGLSDFNGKTVSVWTAECKGYRLPVNGGTATLPAATASAWVGLSYDGPFESTKLAYAAELGTALLQKKRVDHLGLAFDTTARIGVKIGPSFDKLDPLRTLVREVEVDPNMVEADIDEPLEVFGGSWDTDSRFCILAQSPWPCRVKAVVFSISTADAR